MVPPGRMEDVGSEQNEHAEGFEGLQLLWFKAPDTDNAAPRSSGLD